MHAIFSQANDILVSDTLLAVDSKSVKGIRYDQLTPLILGPEGSLVVLTLRRTNGVIIDVHLRRARVGPVGRPAERRRHSLGRQKLQGTPEMPLQTLLEDDERSVNPPLAECLQVCMCLKDDCAHAVLV